MAAQLSYTLAVLWLLSAPAFADQLPDNAFIGSYIAESPEESNPYRPIKGKDAGAFTFHRFGAEINSKTLEENNLRIGVGRMPDQNGENLNTSRKGVRANYSIPFSEW